MGEYARGKNPKSLANLRPAWQKGESGNVVGTDTKITPHIRRFAALPIDTLRELSQKPEKLTVGEAIAMTLLTAALKTGSFSTGAKSRDTVLDRLDGPTAKLDVSVAVSTTVELTWHDGSRA